MTAWRDVEVAAAEALDGPDGGRPGGDPRRHVHRRGGPGARGGHRPRRRRVRRRAGRLRRARPGAGSTSGSTSSDVLDTALALQLRRAGRADRRAARARYAAALAERAREHADTLCVGRTHGVHAEPTSFGLKLAGYAMEAHRNAERLERAFAQAATGAISGAVGTYASLGPDFERARARAARACGRAGLHPGRPARPPRRAAERDRARRRRAGALRDRRSATSSAPRCARSRSRSAPGQKGSSAMPHKRNPITTERITRPRARAARLRAGGAGERRAVARARHLALRRRAGDPARRDDPARLHAAPRHARGARDGRARGPDARQPRDHQRRAVLPAGAAGARRGRACSATTPTGSSSASPSRRGTRARRCASCSSSEGVDARPRRRLRLRPLHPPRPEVLEATGSDPASDAELARPEVADSDVCRRPTPRPTCSTRSRPGSSTRSTTSRPAAAARRPSACSTPTR